jgi:hypothetical protein
MAASPPSPSIAQLHAQRRKLLDQIENLDQIRRGSITEQFVEAVHKDGSKVRRGPYVLYSYKDKGGRTVSRRLKDPQQIAHYRSQIEAFHQFQQCTAQLLGLGEALSDLALEDAEGKKKRGVSARRADRAQRAAGQTARRAQPRPDRP